MLRVLLQNLLRGPATRPYPAEERKMFPSSRGRVESVIENCIFCGLCQKRCPADCLVVNKREKTWSIDPYQCIVCGVCVEVCPTKAIAMRTEFRKPRYERAPLTHHQEPGHNEGPVEG
ncbi:MAG: 4Fe-4S dicluster domain-containing protein [Betaproteobacteria bacterium]